MLTLAIKDTLHLSSFCFGLKRFPGCQNLRPLHVWSQMLPCIIYENYQNVQPKAVFFLQCKLPWYFTWGDKNAKACTVSMMCEFWLWQFLHIRYITQVHDCSHLEISAGMFFHFFLKIFFIRFFFSNLERTRYFLVNLNDYVYYPEYTQTNNII